MEGNKKELKKKSMIHDLCIAVVIVVMAGSGVIAYKVSTGQWVVRTDVKVNETERILEVVIENTKYLNAEEHALTIMKSNPQSGLTWQNDCGKELTDDYDVVFIYKTGCMFCEMTKHQLAKTDAKIYWVNFNECPQFLFKNYNTSESFGFPVAHCLRNDQVHVGLFKSEEHFNAWMDACLGE